MSKQREALEKALLALEIAPLDHNSVKSSFFEKRHYAIIALREALAEPEQEPVAWMMVNKKHGHKPTLHWTPQEDWHITWKAVPLYTAPLARKPLTDSEVFNMAADYYEGYGFKAAEFARAIERAHGIDGGHDCWR